MTPVDLDNARLVGKPSEWPLLALLLGLALLAILALSLIPHDADRRAPPPTASGAVMSSGAAPDAGARALTTAGAIADEADQESLDGRTVRLNGVVVTKVYGDRTFLVADAPGGREVLVSLGQDLDAGGAEKAVAVRQGQTLSIGGQVRRVPDEGAVRSEWALDGADLQAVRGHRVYVTAVNVR